MTHSKVVTKFEDDLYVVDKLYQTYLESYWNGKNANAIHFNHASITAPLPFVHRCAESVQQENLHAGPEKRLRVIEEARKRVASLVNLTEECVVFGNNTTDVASLVFWLVGLQKGDSVVTTDAENESIPRIFEYYMDHANPGDGWVSWQNFAQYSNARRGLIKKQPTGVKITKAGIHGFDDNESIENVIHGIDDSTRLVVFSHVLRENGRIMPVKRVCETIHELNPMIFTLVDGAQCLGTLPKIDFKELGCDFYVAAPHKTLCSETTGVLFVNPKHVNLSTNINAVPRRKQIIKRDQFSDRLAVRANSRFAVSLPEIYALSVVIGYYQRNGWATRNDFFVVDQYLKTLKVKLVEKLGQIDAEILSPISQRFTNFICSFRFPASCNREVVRRLWNRNIFTSYLHRLNAIRASFSIFNSLEEVERFVSVMDQAQKDGET